MRKNIFIILSLCSCCLSGCLSTSPKTDTVMENYTKVMTGEKSLFKAFYAYGLIGDCWNRRGRCYYIKPSGIEHSHCHDEYGHHDTDFFARFVPGFVDRDYRDNYAEYIKMFDKNNGLSEKERYCLTLNYSHYETYDFIHNEDECIVMRRTLLQNDDLFKCLFDYKDFIPDDVKIGTFDNFRDLVNAFIESLSECDRQRQRNQITESEYNTCIDEAKTKVEQIAKSGVLK